jgi:alpha-glucosidase
MTTQLHWTAGLHHDGSALYVSNPYPKLDEEVTIRLRAPLSAPIDRAFVRSIPDGEGHFDRMEIVERDAMSAYWEVRIKVTMPFYNYRFKIISSEGAYTLNQLGVFRSEVPDWHDFKLLADFTSPDWLDNAIFYQIFPDRFRNGNPANDVQTGEWARHGRPVQQRAWGEPPLKWSEGGSTDFFGGDLEGITEKLDYIRELGANALYLNPIFTARSNHRYNVEDYYNVDPHVGGNDALIDLRRASDEAGIRIILDITPNHTGSTHPWFTDAQQNAEAPTADFYTFGQRPDDYVAWLGVRSLPKLNYASEKLRDTMYRAPDAVLRHWLKPPFNMDGWRLDVQNMTARQGGMQFAHKVMRGIRRAVKEENTQAYLLGENFFDASPHLQGDELDAAMNYQGFNLPTWRWLAGYDNGQEWRPEIADTVLLPSEAYADQLNQFRASVPWVVALQQFNQLCSHDTSRILHIVRGDKALVRLGAAMLLAYVGVPCIYYGDEIGMDGGPDPDNRRTMPWDANEWDQDMLAWYRRLIALRHASPALRHGGYQHVFADGGVFAFQRQSPEQRLIVIGYREPDAAAECVIPVWHTGLPNGATLTDLLGSDQSFTVEGGAITLRNLEKGTALVLEAR